jgi:hypothetical protein
MRVRKIISPIYCLPPSPYASIAYVMHNIGACCSLRPPTHTSHSLHPVHVHYNSCIKFTMWWLCNISEANEMHLQPFTTNWKGNVCSQPLFFRQPFLLAAQKSYLNIPTWLPICKNCEKFIPQIRAHAVMYTSIQICEFLCQFDLFHCCLVHL